jgi:riboflavin transporter FmnP
MVMLIRKRQLSWHALVASYAIAVFTADTHEVLFNLLLNLYKFPTHLAKDPVFENELGIIFADTLILPFTFIIFVYYARKSRT